MHASQPDNRFGRSLVPCREGNAVAKSQNVDPLTVFKALSRDYCGTFASAKTSGQDIVGCLTHCAFDRFETTVELMSDGSPHLACRGGCASCCSIRVAATAPEVFKIAFHILGLPAQTRSAILERIFSGHQDTQGLDELQRMERATVCPFIENGLCVIYAVRPLACRGHASFSERACVEALDGNDAEVPVSIPHMTARSLVQNALQSALRDEGVAWAIYELNHALSIALTDPEAESSWLAGEDVFASAMITEVSLDEMAQTFDAIKQIAR